MKRLLPVLMGFAPLLLSSTEGWSLSPCETSSNEDVAFKFSTEHNLRALQLGQVIAELAQVWMIAQMIEVGMKLTRVIGVLLKVSY